MNHLVGPVEFVDERREGVDRGAVGKRARVVHGLSSRPAGLAPVRRTRPQIHRTPPVGHRTSRVSPTVTADRRCGRVRELEAENARLKKMVAERDLEIDVMKEVAKKKW